MPFSCDPNGAMDPALIPIPAVNPDDLESVAAKLKGDGNNIGHTGGFVKSAWGGLAEVYSAPESENLLSAINPVADKGGEIEFALKEVGDALITFAEQARECKAKLVSLKTDLEEFRESIEGDDDWNADEDKYEEHEALKEDINTAVRNYENAERHCANDITELFGGTHFIEANPDGSTKPKDGEQIYGLTHYPTEMDTPWGGPVEPDHPWYTDVAHGSRDFALGMAQGMGVYGEDAYGEMGAIYPFSPEWGSAIASEWSETAQLGKDLLSTWVYVPGAGQSFEEWSQEYISVRADLAHSFVPWTEWDTRPGYVVTQGVLNVGSLAAGGAGVLKIGRFGGGDSPGQGVPGQHDAPDQNQIPNHLTPNQPSASGQSPGERSAEGVGEQLEELSGNQGQIQDLHQNALDDAEALGERAAPDPTTPGGMSDRGTPDENGAGRGAQEDPAGSPQPDAASEGDRSPEEAEPAPAGGGDRNPDESAGAGAGEDPTTVEVQQELQSWVDLADEVGWERAMELAGIQGASQRDLTPAGVAPDGSPSASAHNDGPGASHAQSGIPTPDTPQRGGPAPVGGDGGGPGRGGNETGSSPDTGAPVDRGGSGDGSPANENGFDHRGENGGTAGNGIDNGSRYRAPVVPEENVRYLNKGDDGFPGPKSRFDPKWHLQPNSMYEVEGRGNFYTNEIGDISYIETHPGEKGERNPELSNPRPNTQYAVDVLENPGKKYFYETDALGRTTHAHGELHKLSDEGWDGRSRRDINEDYRSDDQGREGRKGDSEYSARTDLYKKVEWDGGHFFGTGFGGSGHTINLHAQLRSLNQQVTDGTPQTNFYALEDLWRRELDAGNEVKVDFESVYPATGDVPLAVKVNYSINGVPQEPIRYRNVPDLKTDIDPVWEDFLENL